ncbi:hypothetical protein [Mycobacterium antarcticum]|uniref:hypothetical protein n=1 Tax=Mycolicibacterium sp. TUM20983 TaxID=3023369 RepID=UPI0024E08ECC|nr:hypothetical protein [Mycolicibacterium sp. TUM20983]
MPIPEGWQLVQVNGAVLQPTRISICGERGTGGWNGCDTVSLYTFAGSVPPELITQSNDATLLDLGADSVSTHNLAGARSEGDGKGIAGVRSSGYYTLADRRFWAQYSTYYANDDARDIGVLLSHSVVVGADVRARLRGDIADLSDAVHSAFLTRADTVDDDAPTTPLPILGGDQDGP